jgi:hypothetical protein
VQASRLQLTPIQRLRNVLVSCRTRGLLTIGFAVIVLSATALMGAPLATAAKTPAAPNIPEEAGSMNVGIQHTVIINASGYPAPTFTESGTLPGGVTFVSLPGSAELTGTPSAGSGNDYIISMTATNSVGSDTVSDYDLTVFQRIVYPSNFCPAPMTVGQYSHDDQSVAAYPPFAGLAINKVTGNGSSSGDPPSGLSFNDDPNTLPNFLNDDIGWTSGTPAAGDGGKYVFQYYADTFGPGFGAVKLYNCPVVINEAPAFTDAGYSAIAAGSKLATPVTIGGTVGFPKTITVTTSGALPAGVTDQISHNRTTFSVQLKGTPKAGTEGVYPITVTAGNGITTSETYTLIVKAPAAAPSATSLALSTEPDPVTYSASAQTYTATVSGGSSPLTGSVDFSVGSGITAEALVDGQASYTTPDSLDVADDTVTATYTGDPLNASSSATEDLTIQPATTTLTLSAPPSTAFGVPETVTATVACTPSCGATPAGFIDFNQEGVDWDYDMVNGQATFTTDPTIAPSSGNAVTATFSSFSDAPGDFAASGPESVAYDVGDVNLSVMQGDGVETDGTTSVPDGGTVTVDPASNMEFDTVLSAVDSGDGTPPGPVVFDITVGSTDETTSVVTQDGTEDSPSADPGTGQADYYWTIPGNALSAISSSGTGTVTVSYAGSTDFGPDSETFTLDW